MFRSSHWQKPHAVSPALDLVTVRATVSYMHDDAARTPGMQQLAIAFGAVLREIDAVESSRRSKAAGQVISARFFPFRR